MDKPFDVKVTQSPTNPDVLDVEVEIDVARVHPTAWKMLSKPGPLFDRNLVYPCDEKGPYTELPCEVTAVDEDTLLHGERPVDVLTPRGTYHGYVHHGHEVKVGERRTIRIYDEGGGFYADPKVY